jgi:hypothetical protein
MFLWLSYANQCRSHPVVNEAFMDFDGPCSGPELGDNLSLVNRSKCFGNSFAPQKRGTPLERPVHCRLRFSYAGAEML